MISFLLNKLVRDKIVADMQQAGQQPTFKKLDDQAYAQALINKLLEEAKEFQTSTPENSLAELADILEVVETLARQQGSDFAELRTMQAERATKRGGFTEKLFVERIDLADDDPWVEYFAKEPEKYKEVAHGI